MTLTKEHIIFKALSVLLVLTLLVPSTIKLAHVFEHHKHEVCHGGDSTHIHKVDLDCEFQKFQIQNNFNNSHTVYALFQAKENSKEIVSQYYFLTKYQRLHFSLRGPPSLV